MPAAEVIEPSAIRLWTLISILARVNKSDLPSMVDENANLHLPKRTAQNPV